MIGAICGLSFKMTRILAVLDEGHEFIFSQRIATLAGDSKQSKNTSDKKHHNGKHRPKKLKEKIKQFRQEILDLVQNDSDIDRVFQVNINAFPITQKYGEAKK